jgi:predicted ATPase
MDREVTMLQSVRVHQFRALQSVGVPLRPLPVVIGRNDSGKSAFLAALQYLINKFNFQKSDYWREDLRSAIYLAGTTSIGETTYRSDRDVLNPQFMSEVQPSGFFHLDSGGVGMISSGHSEDGAPPPLSTNGEGVATLFDYLLRCDRKRFFAAMDAARLLIPGLQDLNIGTPNPATRRLDLVIEGGLRLPGNLASSGDRLLLFFIALAYHPAPPRAILVEEPETGIHPKRLADVVALLRAITQGKHGAHATQVILTTHSPYLLDMVTLETDQVLVFTRQEDGSCTAEPADAERLKVFLDEFQLGEVWYNQGEAGLVAKKR